MCGIPNFRLRSCQEDKGLGRLSRRIHSVNLIRGASSSLERGFVIADAVGNSGSHLLSQPETPELGRLAAEGFAA